MHKFNVLSENYLRRLSLIYELLLVEFQLFDSVPGSAIMNIDAVNFLS
jgi:hypothetical protein